jgi:PAS domain S-box-containing protein
MPHNASSTGTRSADRLRVRRTRRPCPSPLIHPQGTEAPAVALPAPGESVLLGLLLVDPQGTVQSVNRAAAHLLNADEGDLVGHALRDFIPTLPLRIQGAGRPRKRMARRIDGVSVLVELHIRRARIVGKVRWCVFIRDLSREAWLESELRESRVRLELLRDATSLGICLTNSVGHCIHTNRAWRSMSGLTEAQCLGKGWIRAVHPDDRSALATQWTQARANSRVFAHKFRIIRPNGTIRWISARASPLRGPDGAITGYFGIDEDVTLQHRATERQHLVNEVSRLLSNALTLAEVVPRLLQLLSGGLGASLGEFWEREHGGDVLRVAHIWHQSSRPLREFVQHSRTLHFHIFDGMPGRVVARGKPEWIPQIAQDPQFLRSHAALRAGLQSALALPILFQRRVIGVMAFLSHHSDRPNPELMRLLSGLSSQIGQFMERQRTAEALQRSEECLRRAQSIAGLGSYETELTPCARNHWSREVFTILGRDPNGKPATPEEFLSGIVHADDRPRVREILQKSIRQRRGFDLQFRIVRPDGTVRHVHRVAEPLRDERGRVRRLVGTLWDITERKELERGILEAGEREQRRLGQDLHDGIGQRLTALELFSETLATDLRTTAPHLEAAAREMTLELRKTVVQTRHLSHGLSPVPLEADGLARALRELAAGVSGLARVRCDFESRGAVVLADSAAATHLYRIAQEAVNNALKHSGARRILLSLHRYRSRLELRVMDDGRGLNARPSSLDGVGLRVMRFRADLIGATLDLNSRKGRGTRVCCILRKGT